MNDLNKQQLILLAILVSFVTSIATGIATVALLEEAPTDVTRVINRVVERTVETVVPTPQGASVITKEKTVVIKEEDAIVEAISTISESIVRITHEGVFMGIGVVVSDEGVVATDALGITDEALYVLRFANGVTSAARAVPAESGDDIVLLKPLFGGLPPEKVEEIEDAAVAATLGVSSELNLGQSVIRVGGVATESIAVGIISRVVRGAPAEENAEEPAPVLKIETNLGASAAGAPLVNLFGEIVGLSSSGETGAYVPVEQLSVIFAHYQENQARQ